MNGYRSLLPRPILAVSAAIFRAGEVLLVRRARPPARGLFTLPGGKVETGEMLDAALKREVVEETGLVIEPVALAGHREVITRSAAGVVDSHFVILAFAAVWQSGEPVLNDELDTAVWIDPGRIAEMTTTEGLQPIVMAARACVGRAAGGGDAGGP